MFLKYYNTCKIPNESSLYALTLLFIQSQARDKLEQLRLANEAEVRKELEDQIDDLKVGTCFVSPDQAKTVHSIVYIYLDTIAFGIS